MAEDEPPRTCTALRTPVRRSSHFLCKWVQLEGIEGIGVTASTPHIEEKLPKPFVIVEVKFPEVRIEEGNVLSDPGGH